MKFFPIKVERTPPLPYIVYEWRLHNVCNYNCSFCGTENKDGSVRWLSLEKYKSHTDKLKKISNGKPFWIQITGGEPTLYPELFELATYMKSVGAYISILTNGSRTLRYWKEFRDLHVLDTLFITYHSEQTSDYKHIVEVANLFQDEKTEVIITITHTVKCMDLAFEAQKYFVENTGAKIMLRAMTVVGYDIYSLYTPEQLDRLKKLTWAIGNKRNTKRPNDVPEQHRLQQKIQITYNNNFKSDIVHPQYLMKDRKNNFEGWECYLGSNSLRIDCETIYRGSCGIGETKNLNDDITLYTDPVICDRKECGCSMDLVATKIRPKELYPE